MQHTGMLFLSKARPSAGKDSKGEFTLQFFAVDRIGPYLVEPWRLLWTGPQAQAFFEQQQQAGFVPGTPLNVTCTSARAHVAGRAGAEIVAHVITCAVAPHDTPDLRHQRAAQQRADTATA